MFSYRPLIDPGARDSRAVVACSNRFVAAEFKPGKPDKPDNGNLGKGTEQFGSVTSVSELRPLWPESVQGVRMIRGTPGCYFVHSLSQSSTVLCHRMLLEGLSTQWFSSGK